MTETSTHCTAFHGSRRIASGDVPSVARAIKTVLPDNDAASVLVFDNETSRIVELDLRGGIADVETRYNAGPVRAAGRPKLGVVAREVTLLPRHWDWLAGQPGGASITLRRLVDEARKTLAGRDRVRAAQDATYRFMSTMAGNLAGFEEASRALFAGDRAGFAARMETWPPDVRDHAATLAEAAFAQRAVNETAQPAAAACTAGPKTRVRV